jgi:hypothetical protein
MRPLFRGSVFLLVVVLSACSQAPGVLATAPPQLRLPTLTTEPSQAVSLEATDSPTPEIVPPTPSATIPTVEPTATLTETTIPLPSLIAPTPDETALPLPTAGSDAIQILTPGPLSKVVSPIQLRIYVIPGYDHKATIELYGEDGRLLVREIVFLPYGATWSYYYLEIPFEVGAAGELGRLTISTEDQYGRTVASNSVHLLLMSDGNEEINPPGNLKERCALNFPTAGSVATGGRLTVAGSMRPFNALPTVLELITQDKAVISTRLVTVNPAPDDSYVPFSTDIPYSVSVATPALLVVTEQDDRISGQMYLFSQEVLLKP